MDRRVANAPLSLILLAGLACTQASAAELDPAKAAAIAALRAQLLPALALARSAGTLVASVAAAEIDAKPAPLPLPRPHRTVSDDGPKSAVPAAKDPVAHRLAMGFAAANASPASEPEVELPDPATPLGTVFALAYADAEPAPEGKGKSGSPALSAIAALVDRHAEAQDVPKALAHALVQVESSYRPKATGRNGEIGLMQITPKTARAIGYKGSAKALYDPNTNLTWGMKYLAKAQKLAGGDLCGTLLRYNAGLDAKRGNQSSGKFCAKVKSVMAKQA